MECVEKGLGKRVHITGVVNRAALPALYRCMDVLVLPSRTAEREGFKEQFGVVLVEAMLSQVPVIGSDSGAIPEVIGDSGLIFPEGDIGALTAALQRLRGDPGLCKELAHRGRVRALGRFSAAALADETYHFCCELLASKLNVDW